MKIIKNILTVLVPVSAVVVMTACSSDSSDVVVANSAIGELDPSFNGVGYLTDDNVSGGSGDDEGRSLVIDADAKIVVTGSSLTDNLFDDMVIWRYNCDGTLDTTFNGTGYVTDDSSAGNNGNNDNGYSVVLDADGKIIVAGYSATFDMIIWRYNSDGSIDTTFNGIGYVTHHNAAGGNTYDYGRAVTIDTNGKILVAGASRNSSATYDMVIWRYNSDGTLDTSFDGNGYVVHDSAAGGSGSDIGYSIVTDADSKIVVAGYSTNSDGNDDMALWRYDSNGSLDSTFNGVGYVTDNNVSGGSSNDRGYSVAIDANDKIVVAGYSTNLINTYDMVIWRYNSDGTPDTTFNGVGYVMHNGAAGGTGFNIGYSVVIDTGGKITVAGTSQNNNDYDLAIWRYKSDGTLDTTFNGVGYVTDHNASGGDRDDMGYAVVIDAKGNLVATGISDNTVNEDMAIWRYK